ncbi:TPA: hypothetical protein ACOECQ_000801 [Stenotrophomonas maltophilia]
MSKNSENSRKPLSLSERVRASESRKISAGGRRIPGGVLPSDAAEALDVLQNQRYADSAAGCIARALVEAAERLPKIE